MSRMGTRNGIQKTETGEREVVFTTLCAVTNGGNAGARGGRSRAETEEFHCVSLCRETVFRSEDYLLDLVMVLFLIFGV